jgi:hypothetical protein
MATGRLEVELWVMDMLEPWSSEAVLSPLAAAAALSYHTPLALAAVSIVK